MRVLYMRFPAVFLLLCLLVTFSCKPGEDENQGYTYRIPVSHDGGWAVGSLDDNGIDSSAIEIMVRNVENEIYQRVHGILIIKDNTLLLEEYFPGYSFDGLSTEFDWNVRHYLASCTKSFTSACIGIAVDLGMIAAPAVPGEAAPTAWDPAIVQRKMFSFFPQYDDINRADGKDRITLHHMLTMSAGLYWDESTYPYTDSRNSHNQMNNSPDPVRYVLELELVNEPGTTFRYSSGISIVLGAIVKEVSSLYADVFAEQYLFAPLGIEDYFWWSYPDGNVQTGGGLYMRPRDMAKLGQLYLQGGTWNGTSVISGRWVEESVKDHMTISVTGGYGYQWWTERFTIRGTVLDSYSARGWGGQYIFVFPSLGMVVVFTGGNYYDREPVFDMLRNHLLPAVL
ncbi:MAG: serine hydrolase [bacterium]|nr:serine hydrolase [bacterium]